MTAIVQVGCKNPTVADQVYRLREHGQNARRGND